MSNTNSQGSKPAQSIEIIQDDSFSYEGFEVVRGEFFSHIYEPSITFNKNKIALNTACIKKLPDTEYVQMLVNPIEKKIAVKPCSEDTRDSFRWRCATPGKLSPKQVTCKVFFAKIMSLMDWNPDYRYKIIGKLIESHGQLLFSFNLKSAEVYVRTITDDGKEKTARKPTYPEEWKNQFGIPYEEHKKSLQVDIFNGYAVFEVNENNSDNAALNNNISEDHSNDNNTNNNI